MKIIKIYVILIKDKKNKLSIYPLAANSFIYPRTFFYKAHAQKFCTEYNKLNQKKVVSFKEITVIK